MLVTNNQSKLSDLCVMDEASIRKRIISKLILYISDYNYLEHPYETLLQEVGFYKIKQLLIDEIETVFLNRNSYPNKQQFARQIILQFHSKLQELIEINNLGDQYSLDAYDKYKNELLGEVIPIIDAFDTALLNIDFQKTIFDANSVFTTTREHISISIEDALKTDLQNVDVLGSGLYVGTLFNFENILFNDRGEILLRGEYDFTNKFVSNDGKEYIIVKGEILSIDDLG